MTVLYSTGRNEYLLLWLHVYKYKLFGGGPPRSLRVWSSWDRYSDAFHHIAMKFLWHIQSIKLLKQRRLRRLWLRHFAVNLTGGQPKMYWCLCSTGVRKLYEIAYICHQTQGQHIQWTINSLWWLCLHLELTPRQIYDVIWNPRIVGL
jgi:hypothetical protein